MAAFLSIFWASESHPTSRLTFDKLRSRKRLKLPVVLDVPEHSLRFSHAPHRQRVTFFAEQLLPNVFLLPPVRCAGVEFPAPNPLEARADPWYTESTRNHSFGYGCWILPFINLLLKLIFRFCEWFPPLKKVSFIKKGFLH
jgi:hypothetical protein